VEAARAGEAGAGFAVVADEVRNLAMRAAEAAKSTSGLIEDIVKKIRNGEKLVGVTNEAFKEIMGSSGKVVQLIAEIAGSSQEQSRGIDQVNRAVAEMNSLTQQNAADAEELASIMAMFKTNHHSYEKYGDGRASKKAGQVVGKFGPISEDHFPHEVKEGEGKVIAQPLRQKQGKPKKAAEGKWFAQKDPKDLIPFHDGKEKDEKVLRDF
jgi:methyl-accepting chemotaxis protein